MYLVSRFFNQQFSVHLDVDFIFTFLFFFDNLEFLARKKCRAYSKCHDYYISIKNDDCFQLLFYDLILGNIRNIFFFAIAY